jgi:hypothetical protein
MHLRRPAFSPAFFHIDRDMYPDIEDKLMSPAEAVRRFINDGCQLALGGFTVNRNDGSLSDRHHLLKRGCIPHRETLRVVIEIDKRFFPPCPDLAGQFPEFIIRIA